jgi:ribonuclease HI
MDKGHNNHPQNERCDVLRYGYTKYSVVNRCFYEKKRKSFMKILRV